MQTGMILFFMSAMASFRVVTLIRNMTGKALYPAILRLHYGIVLNLLESYHNTSILVPGICLIPIILHFLLQILPITWIVKSLIRMMHLKRITITAASDLQNW